MAHLLTGDAITAYRLKVLASALKLECLGMKRSGPSAYSIIKREYNLKGSKAKVLMQFESMIAG
jgi:hypothetical protein